MNKKGNNSSSVNWKKIVGIIAAIVVIIILILSLVSCQKKASSDNKKDKRVEEKDKKPKKKDKDKLTFVDQKDNYVAYRVSENTATPVVSNLSNNTTSDESSSEDVPVVVSGPEITSCVGEIVANTNTILYTFTIDAAAGLKTVVLTDAAGNVIEPSTDYQYLLTANGSYTITATDNNDKVVTQDVEVSALITEEELDAALTAGEVSPVQEWVEGHYERINHQRVWVEGHYENTNYKQRDITKNNNEEEGISVKDVKYAATNRNYSSSVNTTTFDNEVDGKVSIGGRNRTVTEVPDTDTSATITNENSNNNYYVYYQVEKTTDAGTAVLDNVKHVDFNS